MGEILAEVDAAIMLDGLDVHRALHISVMMMSRPSRSSRLSAKPFSISNVTWSCRWWQAFTVRTDWTHELPILLMANTPKPIRSHSVQVVWPKLCRVCLASISSVPPPTVHGSIFIPQFVVKRKAEMPPQHRREQARFIGEKKGCRAAARVQLHRLAVRTNLGSDQRHFLVELSKVFGNVPVLSGGDLVADAKQHSDSQNGRCT